MSATNCLRCLVRPSPADAVQRRLAALAIKPLPSRSMSTSSVLLAAKSTPKKKTAVPSRNVPSRPTRQKKNFKKNAQQVDRGRPPAPGERKAYRKRILLSNNNALPVNGLVEVTRDSLADPASAGKVFALSNEVVDQLRAIEAFKTTQSWGMFRQPSTLVRAETAELVRRMEDAVQKQETLRLVLTGSRVSGKSMLLLQAMTHAYLNNWIVFNVPEAQELTTACTEYAQIPATDPPIYMQHAYALKMIQSIRKANQSVLEELKTVRPHPDLSQHVPVGSPLSQLAGNAKEADSAWPIFQALWQELTLKGHGRPPILFCLDGLTHIMKMSAYRSPTFELIHSHDLALVKLFNDCLAGKPDMLPNGGVVLGATTRGNAPRSPSMDLALRQREAQQMGTEVPQEDPYFRHYDSRVKEVLKTVEVMTVAGVSKSEARAIMEYWAASGILRQTVDEKTVSEKWTLGGNGNIGEIERVSLLTMRI
ncbi:mitochondrial ribosomal protein [Thozetella sp. PMI_491]|nr:mitochondrial ribosomal protein [Thozetella sp. PMI_491]